MKQSIVGSDKDEFFRTQNKYISGDQHHDTEAGLPVIRRLNPKRNSEHSNQERDELGGGVGDGETSLPHSTVKLSKTSKRTSRNSNRLGNEEASTRFEGLDFEDRKEVKRRHKKDKDDAKELTALEKDESKDKKEMKLFSGLKFSFVPASLKTAVNRNRIKVFQSHGANILDTYNPKDTTHILVQSKWTTPRVLEALKVDYIPKHVSVVYNTWPSDCISANKLIDTVKYEVPQVPRNSNKASKLETSPKMQVRSKTNATLSPASPQDDLTKLISNSGDPVDIGLSSDSDADIYDLYSKKRKAGLWEKDFIAVPDDDANNPNRAVLAAFSHILAYYESVKDNWKIKAYRTAINSLRRCKRKLKTAEEARKLPGFGGKLADHLEEIVKTGRFSKLEYLTTHNEKGKVISMLLKLYGVGPMTAEKWYQEGVRTLDDVAKREDLTDAQIIGLEHYDDFNQRIPRAEVTKHFEIVENALKDISADMKVYCMGSYRRGQEHCGDVDLIMTKPNVEMHELTVVLYHLINKLTGDGFIKCTLAGRQAEDTRWLGATALDDNSPWRRMDILLVPWNILGSSLIYYTGDDLFNRKIRYLAKQKGYRLSNNGLFLGMKNDKGEMEYTQLIESSSEKKIFEILGVDYRPPEKRNIGLVRRGFERSSLPVT